MHDLPDDVESLKQLVRAQIEELQERNLVIEQLKLQIARLRRAQFGRSSEQLDAEIAQLELTLEELEVNVDPVVDAPKAPVVPATSEPLPTRRALPSHLPRETVTHNSDCRCPDCGQPMRAAGEDVSEMLEYVPGRFKVIRHVRPKFACSPCDKLVQAAAPARTIARGLAGPGLLAHVLVSKYTDHLPLYRQSEIYAREGVTLERSTLADWVGQCSALLQPLVNELAKHVLSAEKLHADDTPVPVLCPGRGTTKQGRLWTYVRDDRASADTTPPAVWFMYTPDRKGRHPVEHLKSYRGILQADAYAGFDGLYERKEHPLVEAACWAHARRKFYEIAQAMDSPLANSALEQIGKLYEIEADIRGRPADQRQAARKARAGPLLKAFHDWCLTTLRQIPKKSVLASAIRYALSRWLALIRYRDDGRIEIDNNIAERSLRAVAIGRKNYLFAGADSGGERAAAIYSLSGTAKLNGIDPEAYLRLVLSRIAAHPANKIAELLPWNVAAELEHAAEKLAA
jgi:transposase